MITAVDTVRLTLLVAACSRDAWPAESSHGTTARTTGNAEAHEVVIAMKPSALTSAGVVLLVMQVACGRDSQARRVDTVAVDTTATSLPVTNPVLAAVPARDSVSAHPVDWTVALVVERLKSAGLSPTLGGPVQQKHMAVPGMRILIPGAALEVYLYGDANAAAPDIDRFDRLTRTPGESSLVWEKPPALVTANNMVIMVLTGDAALRERVRSVLHLSHMHTFPTTAQ